MKIWEAKETNGKNNLKEMGNSGDRKKKGIPPPPPQIYPRMKGKYIIR